METGGFIPWDEWKPILRTFTCPCCSGVRLVPDEEELEQRITAILDKSREEIRDAMVSIDLKQARVAINKEKAVGNE